MVKVNGQLQLNPTSGKASGSLFADNKNDVSPDMSIQGLPDGYEMDWGSSVITADGELAFLKSDGTWNWT